MLLSQGNIQAQPGPSWVDLCLGDELSQHILAILLRHSVVELSSSAVGVALLQFYSVLGVIRSAKEK